jgi:hypothetical protein
MHFIKASMAIAAVLGVAAAQDAIVSLASYTLWNRKADIILGSFEQPGQLRKPRRTRTLARTMWST